MRYHNVYGSYGISVFAARDATLDELAQQVPLVRFARLTLIKVAAVVASCTERARIADSRHAVRAIIAPGLATVGAEELLQRAVDNLIANIRVHTPEGTQATITAAGVDGSVVIDVSDNGPGVPAEELPRVFDRFYRAGAQAHGPGSGLGLAIVAAIAWAHDGTAQATRNNPHGLRITLTVPASRPASCPVPALTASP